MSEAHFVTISCDQPQCRAKYTGQAGQNASTVRRAAARRDSGWVSRRALPTPYQKSVGIFPTWKEDYCPEHAYMVDPEYVAAVKRANGEV